jgi:hypothetical protein
MQKIVNFSVVARSPARTLRCHIQRNTQGTLRETLLKREKAKGLLLFYGFINYSLPTVT